ncbi:hypothetical protein IJG78_03090 [Candidatus Saccharibacteria bacterium]|nr:hypothetical protein [Candidatus Saccharibacteria bacterium]
MDEINIKELLRYVLSKFYIVLLVLVAVVSLGEIYSVYLKTPMYNSTTKLVLTSEQTSNSSITTSDVTLSNNLVKTYSEIIKSRNVLSKVIDSLKLGMTVEQLAGKISVSSITNTQLINVAVSDKDADMAQKIANEVAKQFKAEIITLYKIDNVQIVEKATAAADPYNINVFKQTIEYLLAGLAAGIGIVLIMFYLDNTIKNSKTVEDKVGLVVLGVVPNAGRK